MIHCCLMGTFWENTNFFFLEGNHLNAMLHYSSLLSADLLAKLEDRLQDNVDDIPVNDLVEVGGVERIFLIVHRQGTIN